ncbi:MAG TPA: GIY-YIG nuclease family protein [Sphingomicrobium sp.]
MKGGWVYIMTNKPFGTLHIGVTSDIAARIWQHRNGTGSDFCKRYRLTRLVYAEEHPTIMEAISREKAMKAWNRNWKLRQIIDANPEWSDLFETINR